MSGLAIGIVGCGKIARDQHLPAIAATPGLSVVAVADPFAAHAHLPSHPDMATMLAAHPEIAALSLCQPPQARFEAARAAISEGRHVFLEKPPAASLSEAEALPRLAQEAGVSLFTAWHSREAAGVDAARSWLRGKALRSVSVIWKEDVRVWHPGQRWLSQPGGLGVFDPGVNALSILTALLPEPLRLLSADLEFPSNWQAPIAARLAMATLADVPITAEFDFRQSGPQSWDIQIDTREGRLMLSQGGNRLTIDGLEQICAPEEEYARLYRRFADLVAHRQSEVDLAPLRLATDAFLRGRIAITESFDY